MKRSAYVGLLTVPALAAWLWAPVAFSAPKVGAGGDRMPRYDRKTETTVKGKVEEIFVHSATPAEGLGILQQHGTVVTVKPDDGTAVKVYLGPALFLKTRSFEVAQGEEVEVTGSKVTYQGSDVILTREAKKGSQTLIFRNNKGQPVWGKQAYKAT
jgi:hypothetical protein